MLELLGDTSNENLDPEASQRVGWLLCSAYAYLLRELTATH